MKYGFFDIGKFRIKYAKHVFSRNQLKAILQYRIGVAWDMPLKEIKERISLIFGDDMEKGNLKVERSKSWHKEDV